MNRHLRLAAVAAVFAALGGLALAAEMPQIKVRQDAMKGNGDAAKVLAPMAKGEQPWNQAAAVKAATEIHTTATKIPSLFPAGSGPETGIKTAALPEIWKDKADFDAKAKTLETESGKLLQLAQANDQAGFKTQFGNVGKACGGCHQTYRKKEQ